ncbi:hypothetical protein K431DRAFT_289744 [Polychaeton citri CBS 116435]|uniref:Uncharacterized protein n=1 Tax=Polychaeton citri CBS 116435 TaxID=1314669 RepID=A0A9P4PY88_9PEZI|nr:hypothetical protein K431DRAFT_289744 [Polychaeton citri CBS 116435]
MDALKNTANSASDTVSGGASQAADTASSGSNKWDNMTEEQKKQTFDALPSEQKQGKSYLEWVKEGYYKQYENWMPWIEDQYLKWFTKDNKTSYAAKDTLDKSKVTGIEQVDTLQDGVNNLAAGQVGQGGLLQPVGDLASKEGVNRAERGGKDDSGSYGGPASNVTDPVVENAKAGGEGVANAGSGIGSSLTSGVKGAGGYVSGLWGGKKEEAK